jgi:hypothetical protein
MKLVLRAPPGEALRARVWVSKVVGAGALLATFFAPVGCGNSSPGAPVSTQAPRPPAAVADLLALIEDTSSTAAAFCALPADASPGAAVAAAVGRMSVAKDPLVSAIEGDEAAASPPTPQNENVLQPELENLGKDIENVTERERADASTLHLDLANTRRVGLAAAARALADHLTELRAGAAPESVLQQLERQVSWVESTLVTSIEPAIEHPDPDAFPAGDAFWFQTYEMALNVRIAFAVAGFPIDRSWALERYMKMHSAASISMGSGFAWSYPAADASWDATVQAWSAVFWAVFEAYHPIRGTSDFDHDGVPDVIVHAPVTGDVIATRMVPIGDQSFQVGWSPSGWVRPLGQLDPTVWHLGAVADVNGDGNPDLIWEKMDPAGQIANGQQLRGWGRIWLTDGKSVIQDATLPMWPNGMYCVGSFGRPGALSYVNWSYTTAHDDGHGVSSWGNSALLYRELPVPIVLPESVGEVVGAGGFVVSANSLTRTESDGTPTLDAHWHFRGCADFNGDGVVDPLWYGGGDPDDSVQAWLSAPGKPGTKTVQPTLAGERGGRARDIRAVADFTGDGHPDLLWQDDGDGTLFVTAMNGLADAADVRPVTVVRPRARPIRRHFGFGGFSGE